MQQPDRSASRLITINDLKPPCRCLGIVGVETNPLTLKFARALVSDLNQLFATQHVPLVAKLMAAQHSAIRR